MKLLKRTLALLTSASRGDFTLFRLARREGQELAADSLLEVMVPGHDFELCTVDGTFATKLHFCHVAEGVVQKEK